VGLQVAADRWLPGHYCQRHPRICGLKGEQAQARRRMCVRHGGEGGARAALASKRRTYYIVYRSRSRLYHNTGTIVSSPANRQRASHLPAYTRDGQNNEYRTRYGSTAALHWASAALPTAPIEWC
jgi:hypothetical protein